MENLKVTYDCDWCDKVGERIPASEKRTLPDTKVIDLCTPCAFLWDVVSPRADWACARLDADVLDSLLKAGAIPVQQRRPRNKAVTGAQEDGLQQTIREINAADTQPILPTPREEQPAEEQTVFCLDCTPPREVRYANRSSHANYHGTRVYGVRWASGNIKLDYPCTAHAVCRKTGYALADERSLQLHVNSHFVVEDNPDAVAPAAQKGALRKQRKAGTADTSVPQLTCPLQHRDGAPEPYFVDLRDRAGHAAHHGLDVTGIAYGNPNGIEFPARCKEHPDCAQVDGGLGLGFTSKNGLQVHHNKMVERERKAAAKAAEAQPPAFASVA